MSEYEPCHKCGGVRPYVYDAGPSRPWCRFVFCAACYERFGMIECAPVLEVVAEVADRRSKPDLKVGGVDAE
jgi:hypothetical protein